MASKKYIFLLLLICSFSSLSAKKSFKYYEAKNEFFQKIERSFVLEKKAETSKLIEEAKIKYPESMMTWYYAGRQALETKNYMEAYEYLEKARDIQNEEILDHMLIEVYEAVGEYDLKLQTLQKLWEKNHYNSNVYHRYISLLYDMQKYEPYYDLVKDGLENGYTVPSYLQGHIRHINGLIKKGRLNKDPLEL